MDLNDTDTDGRTPLMKAIRDGDTETANILITKGVNLDAVDQYGRTALIIAADKGYRDILQALINDGAEVNAVDGYGDTALDVATQNGHRVIEALLKTAGGVGVNYLDFYHFLEGIVKYDEWASLIDEKFKTQKDQE